MYFYDIIHIIHLASLVFAQGWMNAMFLYDAFLFMQYIVMCIIYSCNKLYECISMCSHTTLY